MVTWTSDLPIFQEYKYVLQNHTTTTKLYPDAL